MTSRLVIFACLMVVISACFFNRASHDAANRSRSIRWGTLAPHSISSSAKVLRREGAPTIEVVFFEKPAVAIEAFRNGEIDLLTGIGESLSLQLESMAETSWIHVGKEIIFGETRKEKPSFSAEFRGAVFFAIDPTEFARLAPIHLVAKSQETIFSPGEAKRLKQVFAPQAEAIRVAIKANSEDRSLAKSCFENIAVQLQKNLMLRVDLVGEEARADFFLDVAHPLGEPPAPQPAREVLRLGERMVPVLVSAAIQGLTFDSPESPNFSRVNFR